MALNKLTADALVDGTLSSDTLATASVTNDKLNSNIISSQTAIGVVDSTNDTLLIYDNSTTSLKKVAVNSLLSTSDVTEGTNLYYTDERVDDRVAALIVGGNNITATYNDAAGTLTIDGQPGYADSDVATYLSGNLDTSIIPDTDSSYDIGSASYKIRDLYLSNNSLHIGENTLSTNASKLLFNGEDVMDYANITSKPTTLTGYGITDGYANSDVATYLSGNGYATASSIIADITASAPSTLDTLNELAAALGDDPNFATTVTNSIATKASITYVDSSIAAIPATNFESITSDILPYLDEVYDIGSTTSRWYDAFISNSININTATLYGDSSGFSTTSDLVVGSVLTDQLLLSDNLITPDATSVRQYLGDKGVVIINGNLDVDGDWLQVPRVGGTNDVLGEVTADVIGVAGVIRFNVTGNTFEGHDGTEWGSLGGISADAEGNATIDANLIVTGDIISLSDETLKENVTPITSALEKVLALNGVYYNLKTDPNTRHMGLIAQNVETQAEELVYTSNGKKAVAYGNSVALLIEAIKELKAEIEVLKNGV